MEELEGLDIELDKMEGSGSLYRGGRMWLIFVDA